MKKLLFSMIIVIGAICIAPKQTGLPETIDNVIDGVVFIENAKQRCSGSGFAIDDHTIVTARHVVEDGNVFVITMTERQSKKIDIQKVYSDVVEMSYKYDIAYIKFSGHPFKPVTLGTFSECKTGDGVFSIGSPFGLDCFNNVTVGVISSVKRNLTRESIYWSKLFQIDAPCWHGSSGGPIFSMDGKVIGILVGGLSPDFCFAIPVDVLKEK